MKLRNWLPTKYLTEDNPVIGLSFEVGFRRLLVMVGETIIFSMSNMIRGDVDSEVFNCIPAWMYRSHMADAMLANKHQQMGGGFRRTGADTLEVRCAHTPMARSHFSKDGILQFTGRQEYSEYSIVDNDVQGVYRDLISLRRMRKLVNEPYVYGEIAHPRQLTNYEIYRLSGSMPNVGTVGHVDYGRRWPPLYLTKAMYEKQMRDAGIEVDVMAEPDHTIRKLLNNGTHAGPSGHSSLTAMCRNYKLTDLHGGRGTVVSVKPPIPHLPVWPGIHALAAQLNDPRRRVLRRAEAYLANEYYYTGEGMLPKGL